ncbi:hypothetical protein CR203_19295 [Salipaludibacillus neizhouensis]|uniref:DNA mismatch repair protein MutT n=1 Tax=Salipaludibacillus neizhouensis TaxID=885475 RepID=A0A3A9JZM4_9BACI|nr:hypothetical protein [Salipaludibacillus neizhouensis]RKL65629.1 hypothetical protein CR203_19295 [Salipaludibacillus neizhouensis]
MGKKTVTGTDINEVKRLNDKSGLTYNEAKAVLASKENNNVKSKN